MRSMVLAAAIAMALAPAAYADRGKIVRIHYGNGNGVGGAENGCVTFDLMREDDSSETYAIALSASAGPGAMQALGVSTHDGEVAGLTPTIPVPQCFNGTLLGFKRLNFPPAADQ